MLQHESEDLFLPRSTVEKIMNESIKSSKILIKSEVKGFMREASSVFLNYVASKANAILEEEKKKTLNTPHIYKVLIENGFEDFLPVCKKVAENYEDYNKLKPSKQNKFKKSGLTMEELHEEQMKLFNQAKSNNLPINVEDFNGETSEEICIENVERIEN